MMKALFLLTLLLIGLTDVGAVGASTIYVANAGSNTVSVVNGASRVVTAVVPVGVQPRGIAANQNTKLVYVANIGSDSVSVIDGNRSSLTFNTVIKTIPVGALPLGVAVNTATNMVYVSNLTSGSVSVIDGNPASPAFQTVLVTIPTGGFSFAVAVNTNTDLVYITNPDDGIIRVIDGATNSVVTTIPLSPAGGTGAVVNIQTNELYIVAEGGLPAFVVDVNPSSPAFHTVIKQITLPNAPNPGCCPFDIDVNAATNKFYAPDQLGQVTPLTMGHVAVFDGITRSLIATITVGFAPQFVAVDKINQKLYVANTDGNNVIAVDSVSVIDIDPKSPSFHTVIATITQGIGIRPGDLAVLEERDGLTALSLDHFLCYTIKGSKGSTPLQPISGLSLKDQFDSVPLLFDVTKALSLCNPANKNDEGINDAVTHLKGYQIKLTKTDPPQPKPLGHHVKVTNQFETGLLLDTLQVSRLLVPTAKCIDQVGTPCPDPLPPPAANKVDHFKCYKVKSSKGAAKFQPHLGVSVKDQFAADPKLYNIKKPTRLCNPVDKDGEGIENPNDHLLCYQAQPVKGQLKQDPVKGIHLSNQFGLEQVDTIKTKELCVPSEKEDLGALGPVPDEADAGE